MSGPMLDAARTPEERARLKEIDERLARAKPIGWHNLRNDRPGARVSDVGGGLVATCEESSYEPERRLDHAALLAAAPSDLAYLRSLLDMRDRILSDARADVPGPWEELERLRRQAAVMRVALERIWRAAGDVIAAGIALGALQEVDRGETE